MNNVKSTGPSTEPCGTPFIICVWFPWLIYKADFCFWMCLSRQCENCGCCVLVIYSWCMLCASRQVILVSANKLTRYIEPCQLTDDFGGSLDYDHSDWLNKRLVTWCSVKSFIFIINYCKNACCYGNLAPGLSLVPCMCCRFLRSSQKSQRHCWTSCRLSTTVTRAAQWTRRSTCTKTHI